MWGSSSVAVSRTARRAGIRWGTSWCQVGPIGQVGALPVIVGFQIHRHHQTPSGSSWAAFHLAAYQHHPGCGGPEQAVCLIFLHGSADCFHSLGCIRLFQSDLREGRKVEGHPPPASEPCTSNPAERCIDRRPPLPIFPDQSPGRATAWPQVLCIAAWSCSPFPTRQIRRTAGTPAVQAARAAPAGSASRSASRQHRSPF